MKPMAMRVKLGKKSAEVYIEEAEQPIPQRNDQGQYIFHDSEFPENEVLFDTVEEREGFTRFEKVETVPVIRRIGKEYTEPEDGTIFQLKRMSPGMAARFSAATQEERYGLLDEYAPVAISGWRRLINESDESVDFNKELIPVLPTMYQLMLVLEAVSMSLSESSTKKG